MFGLCDVCERGKVFLGGGIVADDVVRGYRRVGPRRQCAESGELLLCRGEGLGRGESGAVDLAELLQYGAIEE